MVKRFHSRRAGGGHTKGRAGGNLVKPGFPAIRAGLFNYFAILFEKVL